MSGERTDQPFSVIISIPSNRKTNVERGITLYGLLNLESEN